MRCTLLRSKAVCRCDRSFLTLILTSERDRAATIWTKVRLAHDKCGILIPLLVWDKTENVSVIYALQCCSNYPSIHSRFLSMMRSQRAACFRVPTIWINRKRNIDFYWRFFLLILTKLYGFSIGYWLRDGRCRTVECSFRGPEGTHSVRQGRNRAEQETKRSVGTTQTKNGWTRSMAPIDIPQSNGQCASSNILCICRILLGWVC